MKQAFEVLISAGDASGNITSGHVDIESIFQFAIQTIYTGTPAGTIQVQGSNDQILAGNTQPVNWANIGSATTLATVASQMINFAGDNAPGYKWMRVVFTAAGTGTLTVKYFGKGA